MSKDPLIQLIHSLTKAEKRNFKLYVNRLKNAEQSNFVRLFAVLDKAKTYDEQHILEKIPGLKKAQLSNTKAHLYKQLLLSLRLSYLNQNPDVQLREQIDYARVLYNKGLYKQSLRMLERAKTQTIRLGLDHLHLEILQFVKMIELQYITGSIASRAEDLTRESTRLTQAIQFQSACNDLSLKLYDLYLKMGYVRNEGDYNRVKTFFEAHLPKFDNYDTLGFNEQLSLSNAHVWYCNIIQDFPNSYRHAQRWVDLFENRPEMIPTRVDLYLKGYHYLLGALFLSRHIKRFDEVLLQLEAFPEKQGLQLNENVALLRDQFVLQHRLNRHLLAGTFTEGAKLAPAVEDFLNEKALRMDTHRKLIFYYKLACLLFGKGDYTQALFYLNQIINQRDVALRSDLHAFARILHLVAHFELGNDRYTDHAIRSTYRFLIKMEEMNQVQKEVFRFLRSLGSIFPQDLRAAFIELKDRLEVLTEDPYERRPFIYFDLISWLESKIEDRPVEEVIQEKAHR